MDDATAPVPGSRMQVPGLRSAPIHPGASHRVVGARRADRSREPDAGLHVPPQARPRIRMGITARPGRHGRVVPSRRGSLPPRSGATPADHERSRRRGRARLSHAAGPSVWAPALRTARCMSRRIPAALRPRRASLPPVQRAPLRAAREAAAAGRGLIIRDETEVEANGHST